MASQETSSNEVENDASDEHAEQSNDALATKLSKELNNWRRRRTNTRTRPMESFSNNGKLRSEPARTIKVRGHETLVIRKSKPMPKPRPGSTPDNNN